LNWQPDSYGNRWADEYDKRFAGLADTEPAIRILSDLANGGPVLELGPGTGRLAIPLSASGLDVVAVEASLKMIEKLREKPGGESVQIHHDSFERYEIGRDFSLIFTSCNTLFDLPSQDAQLSCIQSSAMHLRTGGILVVEASVPWHLLSPSSGMPVAISLDDETVIFQVVMHDKSSQQIFKQRISVEPEGIRLGPVRNRYIWPSELDLMCRLAGLDLQVRWSGWEQGAFNNESRGHISVYCKP